METWKKIRRLWQPFSEAGASHYAAAACYYLISSLIPTSLLVISVVVSIPYNGAVFRLSPSVFPRAFSHLLGRVMEYIAAHQSLSLLSLSSIAALWSSSRTILAIRKGINAMEAQGTGKGYLSRRLRSFAVLVLLLLLLWLWVMGIPYLDRLAGSLLQDSFPSSLLMLFVFILLLYRLLSNTRRPLYYDALGALAAGLVWILSTFLYSIYVNYISAYDTDYGLIGLAFLSFLWLKLCMQVLFLGVRLSHLCAAGQYHPIRLLRSIFSDHS